MASRLIRACPNVLMGPIGHRIGPSPLIELVTAHIDLYLLERASLAITYRHHSLTCASSPCRFTQPHIVYHPASAASAASPPGAYLPSATPTGLILTPPAYYDYGLSPAGAASSANPFAAAAAAAAASASGYSDAAILTPFLPTFGPSSIVSTSTPGHHHQHYTNGTAGHHSSQQAMAAALGIAHTGVTSSSGSAGVTASNSSAASAAATAAAAAFYLNGPTTNGFLTGVITPSSTGAYLTDTRI